MKTERLPVQASAPAGTGAHPDRAAAWEDRFYLLLITFGVLLLYVATLRGQVRYSDTVLPLGDPFTYTIGFFDLLDGAHSSYINGLKRAAQSNWYWLLNFPIALLSPMLTKRFYSLSIVNFAMFALATVSFYRLTRALGSKPAFAFITAWILWLFPINFGYLDYSSVPQLGLDAMFVGVLNVAVAQLLLFSLNPADRKNALLAGFTAGLAIWGRGNSLPVVGTLLFLPAMKLARGWRKDRRPETLRNIALAASITIAMAAAFYYMQGGPIREYYTAHVAFIKRHSWNIKDAMPYLKNIPGFFFWRHENSTPTVALSWLFHAFIAFSVCWTASYLALTGAFIYVCTYAVNIALFTDPHMNIYNCLLIYAPMRIGMTLCLLAVLLAAAARWRWNVRSWLMFPALALIVVYGARLNWAQIPRLPAGIPTPQTVVSAAKSLNQLLGPRGTISVLWYRHYSPTIFQYYLLQEDIPPLKIHRDRYYDDMWSQFDYSEEKRRKVREELKSAFERAGFIIVAEHTDYYGAGYPYSFYRFREEIENYLNSPRSPRYVVRMVLHEFENQRLLVLQRRGEAAGQGEPLALPYGPSTKAARPAYSKVPHF